MSVVPTSPKFVRVDSVLPKNSSYCKTPALYSENDFESYISNEMIETLNLEESNAKKVARRIFQFLGIVGGPAARIPFWNVTMTYGGTNKPLGYTLSISNVASYGGVISWCYLKIISYSFSSPSQVEERLTALNLSGAARTAIKIGVITTGLLAQIPFAYMSYYYNNQNVIYPILVIAMDSAYPIYSLILAAEKGMSIKKLSFREQHIRKLKEEMIATLEYNLTELINSEKGDQDRFFQRLDGVRKSATVSKLDVARKVKNATPEEVKKYLALLLEKEVPVEDKESACRTGGRYLAKLAGATLAVSQVIFLSTLGYNAAKAITDNNAACWSVAGFTGTCYAYLGFDLLVDTSKKTYDYAINFFQGKNKKSLGEVLDPRLRSILRVFALATAALSYAGPLQVCRDFYEGNFGLFMEATSIVGTIITSTYALTDLIDEVIVEKERNRGNENSKQLILIKEAVTKFISVIDKSPTKDFISLTRIIPEALLSKWTEKLSTTESSLKELLLENAS